MGSLVRHESRSSLLNSDDSFMGVACVAHAAVVSLATASSSLCPLASRVAGVAHARRTVTPMHVLDSWSDTGRVEGPTGRRCTKSGVFQPKICVLLQRWHGYIFGRPAVYGGRLQVHFPGGNQPQVPGKVRSHLPSTRRFLVSNSCHMDADWTSGNQWVGRRCVEPHSRGFGC